MSKNVRVFPALMAVSVGVLAFKGADVAQAVAADIDEADKEKSEAQDEAGKVLVGDVSASDAAPEDAGEGGEASAGADAIAQCLPSVDYASETGISEQEILVLRSLAERREELDARETDLEERVQTAAAAEERIEEQIAELKSLEGKVGELLAQMDAKRDERMESLVKTYAAMKPKDAARIFNAMDDDEVLIDLAKSMKPASLAAIMAAMESKKAERLTKDLAALAEPPETADAIGMSSG